MRPKFHFFFLSLVSVLAGCATASKSMREPIPFSSDLQKQAPFIEHAEDAPMKSYLAMNVEFPPVEAIRKTLERRLGIELLHRGEAHVTVITPVEFDRALKSKLTMNEIMRIAGPIQDSAFDAVCVGVGSANLNGRGEQTYFIVVRSPNLLAVRHAVKEAFVNAGGDPEAFDVDKFQPHVTLGYTKRDLHLEDGVIKDESSCLAPLVKADP